MLSVVPHRAAVHTLVVAVKGRRRARRLALQALYELDQSEHDLENIIHGRVIAFMEEHLPRHVPTIARDQSLKMARALAPRVLGDGDSEWPAAFETPRALRAAEALIEQAVYGVRLVRGVVDARPALDDAIAVIAPEWPVAQMAPVDRNLLRIALWEIASAASPERVAISEAVELAREFSGEGARRMVNGALGAYASGDHHLNFDSAEPGASA